MNAHPITQRVFLIAGEASGDALGADLIQALRARKPDIEVAAVGGDAMAAVGAPSQADISGLAVLGFIDGLKAYKRVIEAVEQTTQSALRFKPDAVVLIDSWGFTIRVAQQLRQRAPDIRLIKYIGPQVWATRAGRAKTLAASVDHLICIHDFEPAFYAAYDLRCTICGHPAIGRYKQGAASAFRMRHGLREEERVLLVLPGSRHSEIRRVGPTLWGAAQTLAQRYENIRLALIAAGPVAEAAKAQAPANTLIISEDEKSDAFAGAHLALACSGTVTTEAALQGAPLIIGYKFGWITWALARLILFKAKYATLLNVAADAEVAPEFIQTRFTEHNLIRAAARLLDDDSTRANQIAAQNDALDKMGRRGRPAQEIAADVVLGS